MHRRSICSLLMATLLTIGCTAPVSQSLPQKDTWVIVESQEGGFPLIAKAIKSLPAPAVRESMPLLLHITWFYPATRNRLPDEATLQFIGKAEDKFSSALLEGTKSKLVFSETGNNVRIWRFYVAKTVPVFASLRDAAKELGIEIEYSLQEDPLWQKQESTLKRIKG